MAMAKLEEDVSKAVELLIYQAEVRVLFESNSNKRIEVTVDQEALDKHEITENEFRVALQFLQKKERDINKTYEYADGEMPTDLNHSIEFFHIELPNDFRKILNKYIKYSKGPSSNLITILISTEYGICRIENEKRICYGIRNNSKRKELVTFMLTENNTHHLSELALELNQNENDVLQSIGDINALFKKKLNLNDNLISHIQGSGYRLNTEIFDVISEGSE